MASSDLRDVFNLPTDGIPRPSKKSKAGGTRPNLKGLAREVQSLGGDHPIVIAPEVTFKKKRLISKQPAARWEQRPFRNSAREDRTLVLRHWRQKPVSAVAGADADAAARGDDDQEMEGAGPDKKEEEMEDSSFAKYGVRVSVPQYSDDQYRLNLRSEDWTKEETDYLLSLAKDYDLRWPLIWDRYEYSPPAADGEAGADGDESKAVIPASKERSMEDLKARYYEVASKMMVVQKPEQYMTEGEKSLYTIMSNFDPATEAARKTYAAGFLHRSREEAKEEESLLVEVRRIMARNERFNEERRELYRRLDYPHTDQDISSFKSSAGLQSLLQTLLAADKSKKRRSLAAAAAGESASPATAAGGSSATPAEGSAAAAAAASGAAAASRRDSIAATTAAAAGASGGNRRDSSSVGPAQQATPTPTTAAGKKAAALQEKKKLSEADQVIYGVTYHDRLSSGPTFRTERINKLFSQRSGQMQLRITNVLTELEFPARLPMPTTAVTVQYERLLAGIITLLDVRKQADKLDAELKVERQKKALREEKSGGGKKAVKEGAKADNGGEAAATANTSKEGEKEKEKKPEAGQDKEKEKDAEKEKEKEKEEDKEQEKEKETEKEEQEKDKQQEQQKDKEQEKEKDKDMEENVNANQKEAEEKDNEKEKEAGDKDRLKAEGGGHKRSASVLSVASDKSSKRLKK
ncbi:related to SWR1-complex protein 4 [Cephalotrichum gorgonifer]|uniref:SWR1-complex protein 4 n=1 Tax=Cephalotrichum gorgonifer TaxID=2041049 RepID=A0AAE8SSJ5_9PEZI|nr:related to SWR1-complex protein 4 [Cephalotrichum gorgonifer]